MCYLSVFSLFRPMALYYTSVLFFLATMSWKQTIEDGLISDFFFNFVSNLPKKVVNHFPEHYPPFYSHNSNIRPSPRDVKAFVFPSKLFFFE